MFPPAVAVSSAADAVATDEEPPTFGTVDTPVLVLLLLTFVR